MAREGLTESGQAGSGWGYGVDLQLEEKTGSRAVKPGVGQERFYGAEDADDFADLATNPGCLSSKKTRGANLFYPKIPGPADSRDDGCSIEWLREKVDLSRPRYFGPPNDSPTPGSQ